MGPASLFSIKPLNIIHYAVWFEALFKLWNSFDVPIYPRFRVMYVYFLGNPANLQNREIHGLIVIHRARETLLFIISSTFCLDNLH
jgi:hypothetical protein